MSGTFVVWPSVVHAWFLARAHAALGPDTVDALRSEGAGSNDDVALAQARRVAVAVLSEDWEGEGNRDG